MLATFVFVVVDVLNKLLQIMLQKYKQNIKIFLFISYNLLIV
jgi:hypothetical protein